jgi:hypothetical protein
VGQKVKIKRTNGVSDEQALEAAIKQDSEQMLAEQTATPVKGYQMLKNTVEERLAVARRDQEQAEQEYERLRLLAQLGRAKAHLELMDTSAGKKMRVDEVKSTLDADKDLHELSVAMSDARLALRKVSHVMDDLVLEYRWYMISDMPSGSGGMFSSEY